MSKLTNNLLHAIDYGAVEKKRTANFAYLNEKLGYINKLDLSVSVGAYMYPLYIDKGIVVRKKLQASKIFVPILWPDVFKQCLFLWFFIIWNNYKKLKFVLIL